MDHRDNSYYEANAADISLEDITSSEENKQIYQQIRDDDLAWFNRIALGREGRFYFGVLNCALLRVREGDDLGWLGYFIGKSVKLQGLEIWDLPEREEGEQQMHAFLDGLARNQSIQRVQVSQQLGDYGSTEFLRTLGNMSQLEELLYCCNNLDSNGCSTIGTLLESGACKLKELHLYNNNIGDDGVATLASGLTSIGPSLTYLGLSGNSIGNEGLSAMVAALESCTGLERLDLYGNDFSLATAGLGSLSKWLQTVVLNLEHLNLQRCGINDEGLQALAKGATNHCKDLNLSGNDSITALGLRYLSTSLQSDTCRLENLLIGSINLRDDGAEVLSRGLVGNKVLRCLLLSGDGLGEGEDDIEISPAGWNHFETALCDTSSVNNTYLSNHTVQEFFDYSYDEDEEEDIQKSVALYLQLNKEHPQYAARCKILMNHTHLDMAPLLLWELKFLPLAVGWLERAKYCTTLSIYEDDPDNTKRVFEESEKVFQSRALTALYEFIRGMTEKVLERRDELALVAACDDKIATVKEESDRKITQLEDENKRLRGILKSMRNALDKALKE
eukprot:scaffold15567_cov74-Skeletonema_dohrnii-CCMP3373.AAC.2